MVDVLGLGRPRPGYWCLRCERAWYGAGLGDDWQLSCPDETCDGGAEDMFPIKGHFGHGEAVTAYSERFNELRQRVQREGEVNGTKA